ncbi:MAG: Rrf2 family transcriptional regulator [Planctomycetota bacterium]
MFSMTTEYALRAAVYLGEREGSTQTSQHVAEVTHTPARYAARVLQLLTESGVAHSQRGPSGGFTLARPANEITLLEVVRAIEPMERIKCCPLHLAEHACELCPLHKLMDTVAADAERTLGGVTLADMMQQPLVPLGISPTRGA